MQGGAWLVVSDGTVDKNAGACIGLGADKTGWHVVVDCQTREFLAFDV